MQQQQQQQQQQRPASMAFKVLRAGDIEAVKHLNFLIYGPSGSGKTTLAATAPGPVLMMVAESNALATIHRTNPDAQVVLIESIDTVWAVYEWLRGGAVHEFRTVVLDSLTEVQMMVKAGIAARKGSSNFTFQDWGTIGDKSINLVRLFRELPCHAVFLALSKMEGEEEHQHVMPKLVGRTKEEVPSLVNVVGYTHKRKSDDSGRTEYAVLFDSPGEFLTKTLPGLPPVARPNLGEMVAWIYGSGEETAYSFGERPPKVEGPVPQGSSENGAQTAQSGPPNAATPERTGTNQQGRGGANAKPGDACQGSDDLRIVGPPRLKADLVLAVAKLALFLADGKNDGAGIRIIDAWYEENQGGGVDVAVSEKIGAWKELTVQHLTTIYRRLQTYPAPGENAPATQ